MVEAAQKATSRDPALEAFYRMMKIKKGRAKARVAVAKKLLTAVYYILKRDETYKINSLTRIHLGKPVFFAGH